MKYKEGDNVIIRGNDGKVKNGVIRAILPNTEMLMTPELNWEGEVYIVDCNEKASNGIRYNNTIPLENIISKLCTNQITESQT